MKSKPIGPETAFAGRIEAEGIIPSRLEQSEFTPLHLALQVARIRNRWRLSPHIAATIAGFAYPTGRAAL